MSDINVVYKTQRLLIDMPTRTVTIIMSGPPGPTGPQGPTGSGAGGFNFTQVETPVALELGSTWYKTDTAEAFVWVDDFWVQYAPGGMAELVRIASLEARVTELENR